MVPVRGSEDPNAVSQTRRRRRAALLGAVASAAVALGTSACIPTVARTNARIEPGFDLAVSGSGGLLLESEQPGGGARARDELLLMQAELDLQYGWRADDNQGFALQLKVPNLFWLATLDLFYEFPSSHPWYYGFGGELGPFPSLYGSLTRYLSPSTYLTFTGRIAGDLTDSNSNSGETAQISPQVSLGFDKRVLDLALYASYAYQTGPGLRIDLCFIDDGGACGQGERNKFRKQFVLAGVQVRF